MKHRTLAALLSLSSSLSLSAGCSPHAGPPDGREDRDGEEVDRASQAITNTSALRSPSELGIGAVGVERNGVVTPQCTGAFLYNDVLLTHRRCVEGLPFGSRLVVTNAIDRNVANREIAPWSTSVEWVTARQSSALSWDNDLAMVFLTRPVATGRRDDVNATGGFVRRLTSASRPLSNGAALQCFGFSFPNGRLALGQRLVQVTSAGTRVATVRAGFGENAARSDDGGVCFASDGTIPAVLRFVDSTTWNLVDLTRSPIAQGEIADAYGGSAAAVQTGLWPLGMTSATSGLALSARSNGAGGWVTSVGPALPIWAQGFLNVTLWSGTNNTDVQLRHRGTGRCLAMYASGPVLEYCANTPAGSHPQRFRLFYLPDGSVQVLSASTAQCLTEVGGQAVLRACNTATAGQRWFQGFGRN